MNRRWLGPVLLVAMWGFALAAYPRLPGTIPIHWNASGEVDGWAARWPAAFLSPATATGIWLLMLFLPRIDPKRASYAKFRETYWLIVNLVVLFLAATEVATLGAALGWEIDMPAVTMASVGVLFLVLGNYLPRVRPNWWMGVRTPWTLSSDRVWRETHRVAGWTFAIAGIALLLAALLPSGVHLWVIGGVVLLTVAVPVIHSYRLWRRESAAT